jgi:putative DNA primase/helicase
VFFRLVDATKPTLLLDELDNYLPEDKGALLGAMNSGYSRKGTFHRCVGDNNEVRAFRTFAPFVYAMIGRATGTFDSRTIAIDLRRASPEKARSLTSLEDDSPEDKRLFDMGRKAARWVEDKWDRLKEARPDMGDLVNRTAMNWRPLFAVADLASGTWPERARKAAKALAGGLKDQDLKTKLIIDLKTVMDEDPSSLSEWPSAVLVERLIKMDGRPWAEYRRDGKPITQNALARLLSDFKIGPVDVGPRDARKKGYPREQFDEVFAAYCSSPDSIRATAHNAMNAAQVSSSHPRTERGECADQKCEKSNNDTTVRGCAVEKGGYLISLISRAGAAIIAAAWSGSPTHFVDGIGRDGRTACCYISGARKLGTTGPQTAARPAAAGTISIERA